LLTVCILLGPKEGWEADAATANADRLAAADAADPWVCLAKGLAELRRGNDADAVRWLTAADADESNPDSRRLACSRFFLALAQSRLGYRREAREDLDVGSALLQQKRLQPQQR